MELDLKHGMGLLDDEDACVLDGWWLWSQRSPRRKSVVAPRRPLYYIVGRPHTLAAAQRSGLSDIASMFPVHRLILGMGRYADDRRDVDHLDGNGLNDQRSNLQITTRAVNLANSGARAGSSRLKGVSFERQTRRWKAQITVDGQNRNLGRYDTQEEAAAVYNAAAIEAWGEHARQNAIPPGVIPLRKPRATSQYRGVSFDGNRGRWLAQIMIMGQQRALGRFSTETEAALAYNAAALAALGHRARLNIIRETDA